MMITFMMLLNIGIDTSLADDIAALKNNLPDDVIEGLEC
jgi:hypothetical protein